MFNNLFEFYRSEEWQRFREIVIAERVREDGFVYDEITGKPIVKAYDIILHHEIELTEENVFDFEISLNPKNIKIVSHKTHNYIHNKFGHGMRQVFIVYGSPLSGKTSWVLDNMNEGDLVVDMDYIWTCISGQPIHTKPGKLKAVAFKVRDQLLDCVKYRVGKWDNAYIVGGYAIQAERERIIRDLRAREVYIECTKEECLERLAQCNDRDVDEYTKYIDEWFERFKR